VTKDQQNGKIKLNYNVIFMYTNSKKIISTCLGKNEEDIRLSNTQLKYIKKINPSLYEQIITARRAYEV